MMNHLPNVVTQRDKLQQDAHRQTEVRILKHIRQIQIMINWATDNAIARVQVVLKLLLF